jgi:alkylhydroperoxidase/carboxymuconolactone decarboxylase family protein YurZ/ketosteroid isomerase-like protein
MSFTAAGVAEVERLGSQAMVDKLAATSPDIARLLVDVALGDVLGRPGLDARTRELLAVAMLGALGAEADFVAVHARAALDAGASAAELLEVVMQVVTFAGFPAALRAFAVVEKELALRHTTVPIPRSGRAVVVSFFHALQSGDLESALNVIAPEALWSIPGDTALLPWAGQHRGRAAIREFYELLNDETETESLNLGPIIAHGDLVMVRGEFAYRFPHSQGRYAGAFIIAFTVHDGLIERYEMHEDSLALARGYRNASCA